MTKRYSIFLSVTIAMLVSVASIPTYALDLSGTVGGIGNTVGSVAGSVTNTVGATTGSVGNIVNGTGTAVAPAVNATIAVLSPRAILSADARTTLLGGITAKARVLSPRQLAKLCLTVGGGKNGCGSGNRPAILGLVDARLALLQSKQLLSVCLSVGASCGQTRIDNGGGGPPVSKVSDNEAMARKITCQNILQHQRVYDNVLVRMCSRMLPE